MIPPVYALLTAVSGLTGITSAPVLLAGFFAVTCLAAPALVGIGAAFASIRLSGTHKAQALRLTFTSFAPAFVPLGLGIWIAHYMFHFLSGALTVIPVFQGFLLDHGIRVLGEPAYGLAVSAPTPVIAWVQIIALFGGFTIATLSAQRIAFKLYRKREAAFAAWIPWAIVFLALSLFAFWIFSQPMEMRGAFLS
jgi:hypothetical protein